MTLKEYFKNNFDKVYYINLDSRVDRRDRCIDIFKKYDIYDMVERIPGKVFTESEITDNLFNFFGHTNHINIKGWHTSPKGLTWLGCTTGHLQALQVAKDKNLENILILEDDFEIYDGSNDTVLNYEEVLDNAHNTLKNIKWDLHYLGYYPSPNKGLWSNPIVLGPNIFKGAFLQSAHAIAYSKRAYNKVLEDLLPSTNSLKWKETGGTIDQYLGFILQNNPQYITTAIAPILAYQREGWSDLQQTIKNYTAAYSRYNILMLRDRVPDNFIRFPLNYKKKRGKILTSKMNKKMEWEPISEKEYERYIKNTF